MAANILANDILDAFAHDAFKSLVNNGDGWTLAYEFDGEDYGTLTNATLDILVADWIAKVAEYDEDEPD